MDNNQNPLQDILKKACADTIVSTKELVKELSRDDLVNIREGEMTVGDLRQIVLDLVESKAIKDPSNLNTQTE